MSNFIVQDGYYRGFVIGLMKLVAVHSYAVTRAYRLELFHLEENRILRTTIFENSLLFKRVPNFKVGKRYVVVGWITSNNHIIEVIDMS